MIGRNAVAVRGKVAGHKVEIDNVVPCILFKLTKIICRLDFLSGTAYHEINVHVHGAVKYPVAGGHFALHTGSK